MHRYYLRFADKAHADSIIADFKDDVMNVAVDEIGTLYDQVATDQTGDDGEVIYESIPKDGYHVNVISRYEIAFDPELVVNPSEPQVIFAGGE
ncbi:hypothetical protein [Acinetobacter soli]|uniref:hypothetical protein n=1 Tax=Acinetobacter soli TaxID=487316 RepID=UPI001ABD1A6C|nr:hypothetical protein [Acinetobacter soli]MBO3640306.1 hypothetical protein [Acinetobacter soli]